MLYALCRWRTKQSPRVDELRNEPQNIVEIVDENSDKLSVLSVCLVCSQLLQRMTATHFAAAFDRSAEKYTPLTGPFPRVHKHVLQDQLLNFVQ